MNFETWFASLISDQRWVELLRHYRDDTIKKAGEKVFAQCVADNIVEVRPMSENRKHVYNILCKNPGDKPKPQPFQVQEEKKKEQELAEEWIPADPAHVDKCVKEFFDMLKDSPMVSYRPPKEKIFFNGKPLEKMPPHPITSPQEAYEKDRHFEYIKANYHPLTREKLPGWLAENEYNRLYDEGLI